MIEGLMKQSSHLCYTLRWCIVGDLF